MAFSATALNVLAGAVLLGALGGLLGSFALLRRQSLLGDALAHAALPGVCLAYLATGSKNAEVLLAGAAVAGLAGALLVLGIVRGSRIKEDAAIGLVLSVFFGLGIVLLTHIQKLPDGNQSGLDKFLFGQAATLVVDDLRRMAALAAVVLAALVLFHKELKLLCFDRAFGTTLGLPMRRLEIGLTALLVVVVVVGLQMVGVVLMVATLITPAAAARQWTQRFGAMLALAAAIGAGAGAVGALASASIPKLPTGPTIVLVSSALLLASLLFAPQRGLLAALARERALRARIRGENLLKDLYLVAERDGTFRRPKPYGLLMGQRGQSPRQLHWHSRPLARAGLVERADDALALTACGLAAARALVRKHRLWEVYLERRLELPKDHVHRDAEAMEHVLSDAAVDELAHLLGDPTVDPHGSPIPPRASAAEEATR